MIGGGSGGGQQIAREDASGLVKWLRNNRRALTSTLFLIVMLVGFTMANTEVFTQFKTYRSVMIALPVSIFLVVPLVFVVTAGEIDLSFPSVVGLSSYAFVSIVGPRRRPACRHCGRPDRRRGAGLRQRHPGRAHRPVGAGRHPGHEFLSARLHQHPRRGLLHRHPRNTRHADTHVDDGRHHHDRRESGHSQSDALGAGVHRAWASSCITGTVSACACIAWAIIPRARPRWALM